MSDHLWTHKDVAAFLKISPSSLYVLNRHGERRGQRRRGAPVIEPPRLAEALELDCKQGHFGDEGSQCGACGFNAVIAALRPRERAVIRDVAEAAGADPGTWWGLLAATKRERP